MPLLNEPATAVAALTARLEARCRLGQLSFGGQCRSLAWFSARVGREALYVEVLSPVFARVTTSIVGAGTRGYILQHDPSRSSGGADLYYRLSFSSNVEYSTSHQGWIYRSLIRYRHARMELEVRYVPGRTEYWADGALIRADYRASAESYFDGVPCNADQEMVAQIGCESDADRDAVPIIIAGVIVAGGALAVAALLKAPVLVGVAAVTLGSAFGTAGQVVRSERAKCADARAAWRKDCAIKRGDWERDGPTPLPGPDVGWIPRPNPPDVLDGGGGSSTCLCCKESQVVEESVGKGEEAYATLEILCKDAPGASRLDGTCVRDDCWDR